MFDSVAGAGRAVVRVRFAEVGAWLAGLWGPASAAQVAGLAGVKAGVVPPGGVVPAPGGDGASQDDGPGSSPVGRWLAGLGPGPAAGRVLAGIDPAGVDTFAVVELVAAWQRMIAWAQAGMAGAAAELDRRVRPFEAPPAADAAPAGPGPGAGGRSGGAAALEIAVRVGISRPAAQALVRAGLAFAQALAPVGAALAGGLIDLPRARASVDALAGAPIQTAHQSSS